jgi:hypothetical protein
MGKSKKKIEAEIKKAECKTDKYGVVIIAIGNPIYSHWAFNLCVSLKSHTEGLNVSLITQGNSLVELEQDQKDLFDQIITAPDECTNGVRGYDVFKCKLHLDELSPYDKTLFLDADTIWNNDHSVTEFIHSLDGIEFTSANRGRIDCIDGNLRSGWSDLKIIQQLYGIDYVYDLSSEVMYFEKRTKVFKEARKIYEDIRIQPMKFGEGFPDEVFFMVALELCKMKIHESPWYPSYWQPHYIYDKVKMKKENEIRQFKLLSLGGAFTATNVRRLYYNMAGASLFRIGMIDKYPPMIPLMKSQVIKERRMI